MTHADAGRRHAAPAGRSLTARIGGVAGASAAALLFSEIVSLVQTVALARLLSPTIVGLYVAGTVFTAFLLNFVEGGLRSALVHRRDRIPDAAETVFYATLGSGILMTLGALAAAPVIGTVFHSGTAGAVAAATSGTLLLFSLTNVPEAFLQREFSVHGRVIVGPVVAMTYAATSVSLAATGWGVWSMVVGSYVSQVAWVAAVWIISGWRPGRGRASYRMWRELARYGSPLVLGMLGARAENIAQSVLVGRGLSSAALGWFRYGTRIARIPVTMIIGIGSFSLFPAFSAIAHDAPRFRSAYLRALTVAAIGGGMLSGFIAAVGEPAVVTIFGEQWREAGVVLVAMSGLSVGYVLLCVSEEALKGAGRTALLNWCTLLECGLSIGLLAALIGPFGLVGAGLSVTLTMLVVGAVCTCLARPIIGFSLGEVIRAVSAPLAAGATGAALTMPVDRLVLHADAHATAISIGLLALETALYLAVYAAVLSMLARGTVRAGVRLAHGLLRERAELRYSEQAGRTTRESS